MTHDSDYRPEAQFPSDLEYSRPPHPEPRADPVCQSGKLRHRAGHQPRPLLPHTPTWLLSVPNQGPSLHPSLQAREPRGPSESH